MSEHASHPPLSSTAPPESVPADAPDPRIARAEQRLAMLRELAELGMALTRELTRRAMAAPEAPEAAPDATPASRHPPRHDPADSFARLSRAVRLTLALEATVEDRLSNLRADAVIRTAKRLIATAANQPWVYHRPFPGDFRSTRRNKARDAVFEVINREAFVTKGEVTEMHQAQDTLEMLYERLTEGERYDVHIRGSLKEMVQAICEDLGLHPDWSRWTDDGWPPSALNPRQIWDRFWPSPHEQRQKRKLQ